MRIIKASVFILLFGMTTYSAACQATEITWYASGNGGIVAAGPRASVQAGLEILSKGGNAVDAAA